jgi:hypothetical protein
MPDRIEAFFTRDYPLPWGKRRASKVDSLFSILPNKGSWILLMSSKKEIIVLEICWIPTLAGAVTGMEISTGPS